MKNCVHCGNKHPDNAEFCPQTGKRINDFPIKPTDIKIGINSKSATIKNIESPQRKAVIYSFLLAGFFLIGFGSWILFRPENNQGSKQSIVDIETSPTITDKPISPSTTSSSQDSEKIARVEITDGPTNTMTPIIASQTPSLAPLKKKPLSPNEQSCPGAKPQRVKLGGKATVCTKVDYLVMHTTASEDAPEVRNLKPGLIVTVKDGPVCAFNSSWWFVSTENGNSGWVEEGSDEVDPYYLCPDEK